MMHYGIERGEMTNDLWFHHFTYDVITPTDKHWPATTKLEPTTSSTNDVCELVDSIQTRLDSSAFQIIVILMNIMDNLISYYGN